MKNDIEIVRGTTNTFQIVVTDSLGQPYELKSGEKLLFGVKKSHNDESYIFVKVVTDGIIGVYNVTIDPCDTVDLTCDKYLYDVAIQSGTAFYNVIEASNFILNKNVTKWGCAE